MLELIHLRSFLAVAAELHFGRAAKHLNMTQPPLSRQIQLLEQELGARLFDRNRHGVALTPAGHALLMEGRAIMQRSEAAVQAVRRAAQAEYGRVKIGFLGACTYGFLPRLVVHVRASYPEIEMSFEELSSPLQLEALAFSRIDLALVRPVADMRDVESRCVAREPLALALPADHPLVARRRPELSLLDGQDLIMYSPEADHMRRLLLTAFRMAGVTPRVVQQMSHAQAILSLVSTGLGIAIVPGEARNACFDNVVFRPISLGRNVNVELHAVWRADNRNPALAALRGLLPTPGRED